MTSAVVVANSGRDALRPSGRRAEQRQRDAPPERLRVTPEYARQRARDEHPRRSASLLVRREEPATQERDPQRREIGAVDEAHVDRRQRRARVLRARRVTAGRRRSAAGGWAGRGDAY